MTATSTSSAAGQVFPASPYLAGFDVDSVITAQLAQRYYAQNYRFCLRYLSLQVPESPKDLTAKEVSDILASGLALMAVQHVERGRWKPNGPLGKKHGHAAATNAAAAGIPQGVCVFLDLEDVASHADDVIAYCQAWCAEVSPAGYLPGLYVGFDCGLSASQLSALPFHSFWKAPGPWPSPSQGFQMVQGQTIEIKGDKIDPDITYNDANGGQAAWVALSAPTYPTLEKQTDDHHYMTAVVALQHALHAANASLQLKADGYFGTGTEAAVRSFQTSAGLPSTGVVDAQTWSALVSASCPAS